MSSPKPQNVGESARATVNASVAALPKIQAAINANMAPSELARLLAVQQTAPGFAAVGRQINQDDKIASTTSDLAAIRGGGRELVGEIESLNRTLDPQFYANRDALSKSLLDVIGSYDLNGLTAGESAAIERGVNQGNVAGGNLNTQSAITTTGNAMAFGEGFNAKRNNLLNAINTGAGLLGATKSNIDPTQVVFGRPSSSNPAQFANVGSSVSDTANNIMQNNTSLQNNAQNLKINSPQTYERVLGAMPDYS